MIKKLMGLIGAMFTAASAPTPASAQAGADTAADPIADLGAWLEEFRPDYYAGLNPGVDAAALEAFEAEFNVVLPETFRSLYLWRNGHGDYVAPSLVYNMQFPPLETLAETKEMLDGMIGYDFPDEGFWERSWIPFLENGGGDHLAIVSDGTPRGGAVIMFYHDEAHRGQRAASLEGWLADLVTSMRAGTYELEGQTFAPQ